MSGVSEVVAEHSLDLKECRHYVFKAVALCTCTCNIVSTLKAGEVEPGHPPIGAPPLSVHHEGSKDLVTPTS